MARDRDSSESPPAGGGAGGQSPEPKAHPVFSPSPSRSRDSSPRAAAAREDEGGPASPVPDELLVSKPLRATPDVRRGQRSPHPSPMTPKVNSVFRDKARGLGLKYPDVPPASLAPLGSGRSTRDRGLEEEGEAERGVDKGRRHDGRRSRDVPKDRKEGEDEDEDEEMGEEEDDEGEEEGARGKRRRGEDGSRRVDERVSDGKRRRHDEEAEDGEEEVGERRERGSIASRLGPRDRDERREDDQRRHRDRRDDRRREREEHDRGGRYGGGRDRDLEEGEDDRWDGHRERDDTRGRRGGDGEEEGEYRRRGESRREYSDRGYDRRGRYEEEEGRGRGRGDRDEERGRGERGNGRQVEREGRGRGEMKYSRDRDGGYGDNERSEPRADRGRQARDSSKADEGPAGRDGSKEVAGSADTKAQAPGPPGTAAAPAEPGRAGGVYMPPFKLARLLKEVEDKSSPEYQRLTWDALRKSINGLVNKINASNIKNILPELFGENLVRGRGLFVRACLKSQMASPTFTHVFAALVAVVNTKFPELGELLLRRVVLQFRRAFRRNDKPVLVATTRFMAHLVNQQVAHEILALELLTLLLETPTDDSVEVAVSFVKECGAMLQDVSPQGLHGIFERFRGILHEGEIDKRVQFTIEGLFAVRKAKFEGHPPVTPELDLVEQEDQITHEVSLEDSIDAETTLDIFRVDPNFVENEKKYEAIRREILGEEEEEEGEEGGGGEGDEEEEGEESEEEEDEEEAAAQQEIRDETETNLVNLRRTIYLTIMASVHFEEAGHKLMRIHLDPGQEKELCDMLLACCSQERTYLRYYGLLAQRFCMLNRAYQDCLDTCFVNQYSMIHRLETNKLRNVAKLFAHLLATDAMPWGLLGYIRLTEEDTSSSSRIFIKILFQEMSEHLGLRRLNERLSDPSMAASFEGVFPRDTPKNTRFAINFFTSIGLGGLTDGLREHLKNMPKLIMQQQQQQQLAAAAARRNQSSSESDSDSDSDSESDSGSDSGCGSGSGSGSEDSKSGGSGSDSESESESESESDRDRKKKRRKG